jgi:hypothetical protein
MGRKAWVRRIRPFRPRGHTWTRRPASGGGGTCTRAWCSGRSRRLCLAAESGSALHVAPCAHSFATHLLETGQNIQTHLELLVHKDVSTTMVYTHVLRRGGLGVRSPADALGGAPRAPQGQGFRLRKGLRGSRLKQAKHRLGSQKPRDVTATVVRAKMRS